MLIFKPKKVKAIHKINDNKIYIDAKNTLFATISSTVSIEKVEKVVKEPNIPIIIKYLIKSSEKFLPWVKEIIQPIKNDPKIFINNVLKK